MKILHICNDFSYSKVYKNLYQELDKQGLEQVVYHPLRQESYRGNNVFNFSVEGSKIVYSSFLLKKYHRILFRLKIASLYKDLLRQIDISTVDVSYPTTLFSDGAIAFRLNKEYGIPYIVAVRNTDVNIFLKYRPDLIPLCIRILNNASKIIFISEGLKQLFYSHPKLRRCIKDIQYKTLVIPNGVDNLMLDNLYLRDNKYNESYRMLYVGRFDSNKNIVTVIKALINLKEQFPMITLNLVGGGGDKDQVVKDYISKLDWINYIGFVSDKKQLIGIYRENDFFLMPSIFETFGLVYIEALTQGLPILYTKNQGVDGVFGDEVGVSTYTDVEAVEKSIKELITRENNNLLKIDFEKFRWCNIARSYNDLLNELFKIKLS